MISKIYKVGLDEDDDALTTLRTTITNLIILCTSPFIVSYFPFFYKQRQFNILIFNVFTLIALAVAFYLNHKGRRKLATKIVYITSCFMVVIPIIVYGRSTELQSLGPILMIFVFILFNKVHELIFYSFLICLTMACSFIYIDLYGPLSQQSPFKYDYYANLSFALFSCGLLSFTVMKTLKNYVSHREQAFKQLAEKNEVINQQNVEMELFTTMASHDLKTPARTISGFLGLLSKSDELRSTQSKEYLNLAISGAKQLDTLIEGISTFRQLDKKDIPNNYSETEKVIKNVISQVNPTNDQKIVIEYKSLVNIKILKTHLYHLIQNLIENGLKYNKSEVKRIMIDCEMEKDYVKLNVSDNGIGIEPKYLEYIFEPFKKLHSSHEYESTGLGLSICKKIINLYEGKIIAESSPNGSRFTILLPRKLVWET